jgi:hypothetical protein
MLWAKDRLRQWLGTERAHAIRDWLQPLHLAAVHESIRNHGWDLESLEMSDAQAAVHFANDVQMDLFGRTVTRFFHQYKLDFLRKHLSKDYISRSTFVEVGDSDGLVLLGLGKTGVSINNDPRCIDLITQNGVEAHLGVGEKLEVPDKTYDVAMAFETLEHSLHPVAFLEEMIRVARQRIILSVPGVTRTMIHPRVRGLRVGEEHVFEFSSRDLLRLATHLPLRLAHFSKMSVFASPKKPLAWLVYRLDRNPEVFGGSFRWFDFYIFDIVDTDQGVSLVESKDLYGE